ncbi:hypothetical protein GDO81_023081 [Engystomops pustulosus]|uniref:Uncharacterized protein n=1 Tax=Engystomops pustulosus TaxID=76066 RepID=A0AAV6YM29_ENGPU|nr:hypothetical protein GDO81_023081 [Engystomops pustulosus]
MVHPPPSCIHTQSITRPPSSRVLHHGSFLVKSSPSHTWWPLAGCRPSGFHLILSSNQVLTLKAATSPDVLQPVAGTDGRLSSAYSTASEICSSA